MDTQPQRDPLWKHALLVFLACVVFYAAGFATVQWWRERRGPWEVTFLLHGQGVPAIQINQRHLGIRDVTITFPGTNLPPRAEPATVRFDDPGKAEAIPFGKVRFLDTTFLPGTVTFDLFGHELELLPRTLIVDKRERPWHPGEAFELRAGPLPPSTP
jgi:hypothetical protein